MRTPLVSRETATLTTGPTTPETQVWSRILAETGRTVSSGQLESLLRFADWLAEEAIPAGGIGPYETGRIPNRHIGDSLSFTVMIPSTPVEAILDVGSGVGLPGIPLAVVQPEVEHVLIDRSGRRVDLIRRAVRVLGLDNVEVVLGDVTGLDRSVTNDGFDVVVSRAAIPPVSLRPILENTLRPGGIGILGGSWRQQPEADGYEVVEITLKSLAQPVWFLIMRT